MGRSTSCWRLQLLVAVSKWRLSINSEPLFSLHCHHHHCHIHFHLQLWVGQAVIIVIIAIVILIFIATIIVTWILWKWRSWLENRLVFRGRAAPITSGITRQILRYRQYHRHHRDSCCHRHHQHPTILTYHCHHCHHRHRFHYQQASYDTVNVSVFNKETAPYVAGTAQWILSTALKTEMPPLLKPTFS